MAAALLKSSKHCSEQPKLTEIFHNNETNISLHPSPVTGNLSASYFKMFYLLGTPDIALYDLYYYKTKSLCPCPPTGH